MTWPEVLTEISAMRAIAGDLSWEGDKPPDGAAIDSAWAIASRMQAQQFPGPTRVYVSVNSTIYFEWHGNGSYFEIEFEKPGEAEMRWTL